ncbi:MAG: hypothetical protein ACR2N5_02750 [Solirubrobacterales bacterium]
MIGEWEPPRIETLDAVETRRTVLLPVAGLSGDLQQDLGRGAMGVRITGSLSGDEARDEFLKELRGKFYTGEPVDFVSDILEEAELEQVLIERFEVAESNALPGVFSYALVLREYTEPPEPPDLGFDLGADLDLGLDIDLGLDLLDLPGMLIDVPDVGPLLEPVSAAAQGLRDSLGGVGDLLTPFDDILESPGGGG